MRYTKRLKSLFRVDKDGTEHWNEYIGVSDRDLADKKLLEYEDIDDDLGVEWPILHKALKDTMYFKYQTESGDFVILNAHLYLKPLLNVYSKVIEIKEYRDNAGGCWFVDCAVVKIKDFGKTWALTKEALE